MAGRTLIPVLSVSRFALTPILAPSIPADVTNGNVAPNDGATVLLFINNDSVPHTLSVQVAAGVDSQSVNVRTFTLPVSITRQWSGVWPLQWYGPQILFNLDSAQVVVQAVSFQSV